MPPDVWLWCASNRPVTALEPKGWCGARYACRYSQIALPRDGEDDLIRFCRFSVAIVNSVDYKQMSIQKPEYGLRRKAQRLSSHGIIQSAPEQRARAHVSAESAAPIRHKRSQGGGSCNHMPESPVILGKLPTVEPHTTSSVG